MGNTFVDAAKAVFQSATVLQFYVVYENPVSSTSSLAFDVVTLAVAFW